MRLHFLGVMSAIENHINFPMLDYLPAVNISIQGPETKSQKVGPKHCTICDISCVQFVVKGAPSPNALYQKRDLYILQLLYKNFITEIKFIFVFVWEFVSACK